MKRSMSTLVTTLLLLTAIVPQAMAQTQPYGTEDLSTPSVTLPAPPTATTMPSNAKMDGLSQPSQAQQSPVTASNLEQAQPSVDSTYPAYCPFLPAGVKPGDWEYRESLEKCLHGV